eukprot:Anaeramoba_ignava/a350187_9.p1 GENE.a350187_9~~a350187_9.p1  ORF type:complete len:176 (-),score=1.75 a350187_9:314-841(-)
MSFTLFLALFLIMAGLGYLAKAIFKIDLPMQRYLLGSFIVLIGVHFLIIQLDDADSPDSHHTWFSSRDFHISTSDDNDYAVIFGRSTIDLSNITLDEEQSKISIAVVFGNADVILPDSVQYKIESNVAFGNTRYYNDVSHSFGEFTNVSDGFDASKEYIYIEGDVAFGSIRWIKK